MAALSCEQSPFDFPEKMEKRKRASCLGKLKGNLFNGWVDLDLL